VPIVKELALPISLALTSKQFHYAVYLAYNLEKPVKNLNDIIHRSAINAGLPAGYAMALTLYGLRDWMSQSQELPGLVFCHGPRHLRYVQNSCQVLGRDLGQDLVPFYMTATGRQEIMYFCTKCYFEGCPELCSKSSFDFLASRTTHVS